jgi:glucan-binding YG repeat protein
MIYQEFPFLKIEIDEKTATIIMTWNGSFSSQDYRRGTLACVEAVKSFQLKNWLADTSRIGEIKPEDQTWTNENVLFPISDLGVRKVAIVIPEDVYNHLAISSIMVQGKGRFKFTSQYFVHRSEAFNWIRLN